MIAFPTDVRDPNFLRNLNWYNQQQNQAAANQKVHDEYLQYSASWVAAQTKQAQQGLTVSPPNPVPNQTIYNDDFTISNPPFPDLKAPALDPVTLAPASTTAFAGLNPTGATVDSQATLLMLQHIISELDLIKAKVGA